METDNTPKHTPTPWIVKERLTDWAIKSSHSQYPIALIQNKWRVQQANETNAAFIVKACNNHQQLIDLLKEVECELNNCGPGPNEWMGKLLEKVSAVLKASE